VFRRLSLLLLFILVGLLVLPGIVLGSYNYYMTISVTNNGTEAFSGLPVLITLDNSQLASLGYIEASGLDTDTLEGASSVKYLVADDNLGLFIPSILEGQGRTYYYRLGDSVGQDSFPVIMGYGGYTTLDDGDTPELGNNFSIEFDGLLTEGVFPVVEGNSSGTVDTEQTSHAVNLSSVENGELLILIFSCYDPTVATPTITWPADWTSLSKTQGIHHSEGVAYKVADGEGTSVNVTTAASGYSAYQLYRISGYSLMPQLAADSYGNTNSPNPPVESPAPVGYTLWVAAFGISDSASRTVSSYPSSYTGGEYTQSSSGYAAVGSAVRNLTADSEDPGTFTLSGTADCKAYTIAVLGSLVTLSKGSAIIVYLVDGNLMATMLSGTPKMVMASNVSGYEHSYSIWADTANLGIDVDGSTVNSTALAGQSVPSNANNWLISIPCFDYYKQSVNGTLKVWYEPVTMVLGTTLTDRSGIGAHGVITWGSNPSCIEIELGGIEPYTSFVIPGGSNATETIPSIMPPSGSIPTSTSPGATGQGLPLYYSFKGAADSLDWSVPTTYMVMFLIIALAMGFAGMVAMRSMWGFTIGFGAFSVFFSQVRDSGGYTVVPFGVTILCVAAAIFIGYLCRNN